MRVLNWKIGFIVNKIIWEDFCLSFLRKLVNNSFSSLKETVNY